MEGILCSPGYIPTCVYEYDLFINKNVYPGSDCPFGCKFYGKEIKYGKGLCPTAEDILKTSIRLNVNEFYTQDDLNDTINAIRKVSEYYSYNK
jgi:perosamine synthetase